LYHKMVFKVGIIVALFGLIMSRKQVLEWVAPMSSLDAIIVWYIAFGVFLTLLGFYVFGGRWNPRYTIALLLISWALGIVLYYPMSPYSTEVTGASVTGVESATEDYTTYQFLQGIGINDSSGIITYGVIPFVLVLLSGLVVAPSLFSKVFRSVVGR